MDTRPNAPSDEAEEVHFVFNHTQYDQSHNSIYFMNFSFPPVLNVPFEAHPQNLQQSLPRKIFQSSSAVRNEARLIAEFFGTYLDDSVQEVTHGSVSQFLNQYMGPELFAKIRGTSTFCAKDYKKSTKKRNWNPIALELFFSLLEQHKEVKFVCFYFSFNDACIKVDDYKEFMNQFTVNVGYSTCVSYEFEASEDTILRGYFELGGYKIIC
ncbi:hypothetical protein C1646_675757 [Rhizophagus diaphanus]|nr:hypothetical protein C1646_675757 [Rhizophagus diaphanus] [Rhizophagus sp. MUCL 43196]